MDIGIFISRLIHIITGAAWLGGMLYMAIIEVPVLRKNLNPTDFSQNMTLLGKRFQKVGWILMLLLFISGIGTIIIHSNLDSVLENSLYISSLTAKLIIFTLITINTAIHTLYLGPKMSSINERLEASNDEELALSIIELRKRSMISSALNLLMTLVIVVFGIIAAHI